MSEAEQSSMPPPPLPTTEPPTSDIINEGEGKPAESMDFTTSAAADAAAMPPPEVKSTSQEPKKVEVSLKNEFIL